MSEKEVINGQVTETTVTSVTSTTSVTLHPAGGVYLNVARKFKDETEYSKDTLVIEPIGNHEYLYKIGNRKGVEKAYRPDKSNEWFLDIGEKSFKFEGTPIKVAFFRTPSKKFISEYLSEGYKPKEMKDIFNELVSYLRASFDFVNQNDPILIALGIMSSWLRDYLRAFFYSGLDATKGAGKTSLLYAMSLLSKHGVMGGDISTAYLARAVDNQKLSIFVDEIDEMTKDKKAEIEAILRKGQRKGNTYNRVNPNTYEPESFEVHGSHGFSYRQTIEDALKHRTLVHRLKVSSDKALPVMNYHVEPLTEALYNDLFGYFMEYADILSYVSYEVTQVTELLGGTTVTSPEEMRKKVFDHFTKHFKEEEIELMNSLVGRNIELCFVCLEIIHKLGIEAFEAVKHALISKQCDEEIPESLYLDKLKEHLIILWNDIGVREHWTLKKGEYENCFYQTKNSVFSSFVQFLKQSDIPPVGSSRFNGLLKDIGFVEGLNWKNQKDPENNSVKCLIYDKSIMDTLGVSNA